MTASCLSTPFAPPSSPRLRRVRPLAPGPRPGTALPSEASSGDLGGAGCWPVAGLVALLLLAAALVAPEQPAAQAAICERHNGAAACRVW